jgi:hypothetical protein
MFAIGKKVVCIRSFKDPHSGNQALNGDEFIVLGIQTAPCGCHQLDLNIGLRANPSWNMFCEFCLSSYPKPINGVQRVGSQYFATLDDGELSDFSIENILEEAELLFSS